MQRPMLPKPDVFSRYTDDQVVPDSTTQPPLKLKYRELKRSRSSWRSSMDEKNSEQLPNFNLDESDDSAFLEN